MNFSIEGLIGLIGGALVMTGFPILLFGDDFDPLKKPTPIGLIAGLVTGLGMIGILTAFVSVSGRMLWAAISAQ